MADYRKRIKRLHEQPFASNHVHNINVQATDSDDPYAKIARIPDHICSIEDHLKKKNCKGNPWCVYGLGEMKDGVWSAALIYSEYIGPDPARLLREISPDKNSFKKPTGLKNLGATCYINALIQSLFHNCFVREAIYNLWIDYSISPQNLNEMEQVVLALQTVFSNMESSSFRVFDMKELIDLLGIDKSQQQDPQEFSKLFIGRIEGLRLPSKDPSIYSLHKLYNGRHRYSTICGRCSHESSQEMIFNELDLSIEGHESLQSAITSFYSNEELSFENQYACPKCQSKQDAIRTTTILESPIILNLQLLRYMYDKKTFEKKKLAIDVVYPDVLNYNNQEYKLVAVLYHHGRSAYGGHYVCDVLQWKGGDSCSDPHGGNFAETWWFIDDENCTNVKNPSMNLNSVEKLTSDTESRTTSESKKLDDSLTHRPQPEVIELDDDDMNVQNPDPSDKKFNGKTNSKKSNKVNTTDKPNQNSIRQKRKKFSMDVCDLTAMKDNQPVTSRKVEIDRKKDAYMLVYVKLDCYQNYVRKEGSNSDIVPSTLQEIVAKSSKELMASISDYQQKMSELQDLIKQRKMDYERTKESLAPTIRGEMDCEFHFISTERLRDWIVGEKKTLNYSTDSSLPSLRHDHGLTLSTGSVSNEMFLCPHKIGIDLKFITDVKLISNEAFEIISQRTKCDLDINDKNYRCHRCYDDQLSYKTKNLEVFERQKQILSMMDKRMTKVEVEKMQRTGYLISKQWYSQLRKENVALQKQISNNNMQGTKAIELKKDQSSSSSSSSLIHDPSDRMDNDDAIVIESMNGNQDTDHKADRAEKDTTSLNHHPFAALLCVHGRPMSGFSKKANVVETATWMHIVDYYKYLKVNKFEDAAYIRSQAPCCQICEKTKEAVVASIKQMQEDRWKEVEDNPSLLRLHKAKKCIPEELAAFIASNQTGNDPTRYYAVDAEWLVQWRRYVANKDSDARPEALTNHRLRCPHGLSLFSNYVVLLCDGVNILQDDDYLECIKRMKTWNAKQDKDEAKDSPEPTIPYVELVTENQWTSLLLTYHPLNVTHSSKEKAEIKEIDSDLGTNQELFCIQIAPKPKKRFEVTPIRCEECIQKRTAEQRNSKLNFCNKKIKIRVVIDAELIAAMVLGNETHEKEQSDCIKGMEVESGGSLRRSERTVPKKKKYQHSKITVSSTDSLALARLKIFEALSDKDLPPTKQRLFCQGKELIPFTSSDKKKCNTLMDFQVSVDDTIDVIDTRCLSLNHQNGNNDIQEDIDVGVVDNWNEAFSGNSNESIERGFHGTLLTQLDRSEKNHINMIQNIEMLVDEN